MNKSHEVVFSLISKYGGEYGKQKPFEISRSADDKQILIYVKTGLPKEFFEDILAAGYTETGKVEWLASGKNKSLFVPWVVFEVKKE